MFELTINPGQLTLNELRQISRRKVKLSLNGSAIPAIQASTQVVNDVIPKIWTNCSAALYCRTRQVLAN